MASCRLTCPVAGDRSVRQRARSREVGKSSVGIDGVVSTTSTHLSFVAGAGHVALRVVDQGRRLMEIIVAEASI